MKLEEITIWRSTSTNSSSRKILPSSSTHHHGRTLSSSSSAATTSSSDTMDKSLSLPRLSKTRSTLTALLRSLIPTLTAVPTCRWPAPHALGRKVTGTLFGHRKGHVTFAVQEHPRSDPVLLMELATSTSALVKEMSSGLVRIALECKKSSPSKLYSEPVWTMYCNGSKCGYAMPRPCSEFDLHVLRTVQTVSVGAGVIPQLFDRKVDGASEGELVYMRAKFERVMGTRDSEAFYMLNPDGNGGPELSIFLLRL